MITLTNAGYITLIALSILAGYTIHGIVDAIKDGTFFDWNKKAGSWWTDLQEDINQN